MTSLGMFGKIGCDRGSKWLESGIEPILFFNCSSLLVTFSCLNPVGHGQMVNGAFNPVGG